MAKQLKLLKLELRNFKGIKSFVLDTRGGNAKVYGDNATGKTTVFDAFNWLLFDKDSNNKKDFSIKTLDGTGKELHMLDHEVEGTFLADGRELVLRKKYSEKWTKKRGSVTAEFTGHTTDYSIDGVPAKLKEYKEKVESIVNEDVFKLLTSPSFFNEQLKWQDRRQTLLEICGDITDEDVIASSKELSPLASILSGRSIENHRKVIAAKRKEINEELDKIPVRIDEIHRGLPDLSGLDKQKLGHDINQLNAEIDSLMAQISNIRNGKAISEKEKAIQEIEIQLLELKREHDSESKDRLYQLQARIQEEKSNVSILTSKLDGVKNSVRYNGEDTQRVNDQLQKLTKQWHEVNGQVFEHKDACECPACGQSLPEEKVNAAREKALSQFNLKKATQLEEVNAKGKQFSEKRKTLLQDNLKLSKEQEKISAQIAEKQEQLSKLNEQYSQQANLVTDILENPQYIAKLQDKKAIESQIAQLREMSEQSIQDIQKEIIETKAKRDQLQSDVGAFSVVERAESRIGALEAEQKELSAEFERLEHELYLTEEFVRTKVNLLTEKINSRFKYATFKLFETQINGGLTEVCETLYEGVPYSSGLNNAAKINVGLDIINTLSEHYGFKAPIFIDNAEAVTKLIDVDTQVVSLVVSEKDKQLRIELEHGLSDAGELVESIRYQQDAEVI